MKKRKDMFTKRIATILLTQAGLLDKPGNELAPDFNRVGEILRSKEWRREKDEENKE